MISDTYIFITESIFKALIAFQVFSNELETCAVHVSGAIDPCEKFSWFEMLMPCVLIGKVFTCLHAFHKLQNPWHLILLIESLNAINIAILAFKEQDS